MGQEKPEEEEQEELEVEQLERGYQPEPELERGSRSRAGASRNSYVGSTLHSMEPEPEPSPLEAENAALRTETARLQREVVTLKGLLAEQTRVAAAAEAAAMQSSLQRTIAALEEEEGAAEGAGADERWSGSDTAAAGACVLCNLVIGCALAAAAAILLMAEPATSPCRQVEQAGASMLPACAGSLLAAAAATGRGRPLPPHVCGESPPPWAQAVLRTAGLCERPERPAADAEGERATPPLLSMEVEHGGVFVLGRRFFGSAARLAIWEGEEPGQVAEVRACVRRWRRLGLTRGVWAALAGAPRRRGDRRRSQGRRQAAGGRRAADLRGAPHPAMGGYTDRAGRRRCAAGCV